jgi:uncharacterized protein YbaP (TraB family)
MREYPKTNKIIRAAASFLGVLLLLLSFTEVRADADEALLWSVKSSNGAVLYLLGSVHMAKESIFPLKPVVTDAFESSGRLYVELDPDGMETAATLKIITQKGMYHDGETLIGNLDSSLKALLEPHLRLLPMGARTVLKPWLAAVTLDVLVLEKMGYKSVYGIDRYFLNAAKEKGMEYIELETPMEQLNLFADMSDDESKLFLRATLLEINKIEEYMEELLTAWSSGDEDAFEKAFFETFTTWPELAPLLERTLFARNVIMAQRLFPAMEEPGKVSIAVLGAGHMIGPRGIPAIFSGAGFEVKKY